MADISLIVNRYSDMVYRLALIHTKNRHDAEDICQDVFVKLMRNINKLRSEEHIKAWLIRVTINSSRSLFSGAWNRKTCALDDSVSFVMPEESSAVLRLPAKYRGAVHLFYYEDYSIAEISRILNQSESATKMQLSRARDMLRVKLGEEYLYV